MRITPLLLILIITAPILAQEPKTQKGIPYAEPKNERQMLDVYAPTTGKNLPVVVWIHGGGWRRGDKADMHNKPKAFTEKGFVLVSISYRFVPNVTVDQKRAKSYRMTFGDEASQKNLSAVTHVAKGKNIPPFLILHVADHPETKAQSQRLVKVLEAAGISARAYPAEGKNHTTINVDLGLADDPATREMFGFLNGVLKKADKDAKKRTLQHFQKTLDKTFTPAETVAAFGEPDRKLGSGLIIYEYNLDDDTRIRLAFPGFVPIESAQHVQKDGKFEVIPVK